MNDAFGVRGGQSVGDLRAILDGLLDRQILPRFKRAASVSPSTSSITR